MFERNSNTIQHMTATSHRGGGGTVRPTYDSFPMPENAKPTSPGQHQNTNPYTVRTSVTQLDTIRHMPYNIFTDKLVSNSKLL
jgi:hypothetical protein